MPPLRRKHVWVRQGDATPELDSEPEVDAMDEEDERPQNDNNGRVNKTNPNNAAEGLPLEPPPPFDPKTFKHQPISAAQHQKMKAVMESWDMPKVPLDALALLVRESAVLLTEVGEDADPITLRMLDKSMKEVVDMQNELNARKNAALGLREALTRGGVIVDPVTHWDKRVQEGVADYQKKTARQKYANDKTYVEYREELWNVINEGAMPPLKSIIPREDGDESDDEDDVEIGGMVITLRDPLTKGWLEDPVTSKKCYHSYSRNTMHQYLTPAREAKKCPAAGCGEMVSRADLEDDENLARQVRNARRKEEEENRARRGRRTTMVVDSDDEIVE